MNNEIQRYKVRFAPSPTGLLHIGNARAALINWLFARHHRLNGADATFLLRLDDTDLQRSEERFATAIQEDLTWLGLTWDCYEKQSDRFERYDEVVALLKASGRLYPCYETPEELDFKRKRQLSRGEPPIYDRIALKLSADEKAAFEAQGRRPHWRFLLKDEDVSWDDLVRGHTHFPGHTLSDPVLVRADGAYLYTITSVVDDIDFDITHVIRGEDHVTNTSVQIQLFAAVYEALKLTPAPLTFAHTTLMTDAQGGGLSKRLGSLSLQEMRQAGTEPMAINSLLARLGTSLPVEPKLNLDDLAQDFSLNIFSRTPPRFDTTELRTLNHKLFQITPYETVKERLPKDVDESLWTIVRGNLETLDKIDEWRTILSGDVINMAAPEDRPYLDQARACLPEEPWSTDTWSQWTNQLKETTGRKGKQLFMPLRQALTGMDHGPEMKELLPRIGRALALKRLS